MREYLLYGIAKDQTERYTEELLLVTTNQSNIDRVKEIASQEGWHSFRESTYNGEAPNFTKTLNI